jgi:hypothetical protein
MLHRSRKVVRSALERTEREVAVRGLDLRAAVRVCGRPQRGDVLRRAERQVDRRDVVPLEPAGWIGSSSTGEKPCISDRRSLSSTGFAGSMP